MGCFPQALPSSVRTLCASLALATSIVSQSLGDWRPVPSRTVPPPRTGFELTELGNGDLLMFGGNAATATDEWIWDGFDWQPIVTNVPRRDNPAMATLDGAVLMFGGVSGGQILSDCWTTSNGAAWSQVGNPIGTLTEVSMAAEEPQSRFVLIGKNLGGTYETWFFSTVFGWTAGPSFNAFDARVVQDRTRERVLLIADQSNTVDISALDQGHWQPFGQVSSALALGEVAFDARRGNALLVQPFDDLQVAEWNGVTMQFSGAPTGSILPPGSAAMNWHGRRDEVVLVVNRGNGMETLRHAVDAAANAVPFGPWCGAELELAANSIPTPGATHVLGSIPPVGSVAFSAIGFSRTVSQGVPLPIPLPGGCELQVDPVIPAFLGGGTTVSHVVTLPPSPQLLGERYDAQFVFVDGSSSVFASTALEVQIGMPRPEFELVEAFQNDANRDLRTSAGFWSGGSAQLGRIGGDGRHGSFDLSIATQVAPNAYEIDTDTAVIPASNTLSGTAQAVLLGRFFFTDFFVPQGVTVRFVGSTPAQVFVRGQVDIQGAVSVDAPDMPAVVQASGPATGLMVSTFNARQSVLGQPGGAGGPGGGRGGNGGRECLDQGPIVVGGIDVTSGQGGDDIQVGAAHAYAGSTIDTGGAGSPLMPASGTWGSAPFPTVGNVYSPYFSRGGNGGGFAGPGGTALQPVHSNPFYTVLSSPAVVASQPFAALPLPAGATSLEHFSIGGSGGGGGGSHGYGLLAIGSNPIERWMAGHGGAGGGGVLAIRAGNDVSVTGRLSSRGGSCPIVSGDDPSITSITDTFGISSPGGGGSGGSVLVQGRVVQFAGDMDVAGGAGGVSDFMVNTLQSMTGGGGDGAAGFYRFEATNGVGFTGTATTPFVPQQNSGPVVDEDDRTGFRTRWMVPSSNGLPIWMRYELLVEVNGLPVLLSDDDTVSPLGAFGNPFPALLRMQGCRLGASGQPVPGTIGPWRLQASGSGGNLNQDLAQAVRFDVVLDKTLGVTRVLGLRMIWR